MHRKLKILELKIKTNKNIEIFSFEHSILFKSSKKKDADKILCNLLLELLTDLYK